MDSFGIDPLNMTKLDTASSLSSRQKSCNACVRGKRRCDKRTPRCTRCAAKGLDCVYHKLPPSHAGSTSSSAAQQQHQPASGSTSPEMTDVPDFDMGFDYESLGTETSPESMCHVPDQPPQLHQQHNHSLHHHHHSNNNNNTHLHLGPGLDFDIVDFMNAVPTSNTQTTATLSPPSAHDATGGANSFFASLFEGTTAAGGTGASKMDIPPVPFMSSALVPQVPKTPVRDLSLLRPDVACDGGRLDALAVHDPRSWLGYTMRSLTGMHTTFAQTRALPFLHPRLWAAQLPAAILAVFSAATAYANRSDDNRAWIMKLLADTAVAVHREGEGAATPHDKLARVQALVILDSMRVFDGDVGMRAAAEREAHILSAWIGELQQVVNTLENEAVQHAQGGAAGLVPDSMDAAGGGGGAGYPSRDRPPRGWDAWILLESARRTLVFSCAFVCMNKLLKSIDVSRSMWRNLRFTASRHLWEAPSSVDFFRAWREKPQYYIRDFDFKDFWSYARPDDLDEFTKVMLMPQIGMDTLEHFMAGEDLSHVSAA